MSLLPIADSNAQLYISRDQETCLSICDSVLAWRRGNSNIYALSEELINKLVACTEQVFICVQITLLIWFHVNSALGSEGTLP